MFNLTPEQARIEWVKALRSGNYKQTVEFLNDKDGHCCLGVACEAFMDFEEGLSKVISGDICGYYSKTGDYGGHNECTLPNKVKEWLKIKSYSGLRDDAMSLVELNDNETSFEEIASIIETDSSLWEK